MKIGIFGNTNNYPFALSLLLQEKGHSTLLVVTEKSLLHRPESRNANYAKRYPDWIMDLSHLSEWQLMSLHPSMAEVIAKLSQCDVLMLNATGPSLFPLLNKPSISLLTGSDLSDYANLLSVNNRTKSWDPAYLDSPEGKRNIEILSDFIIRQRIGIQNSLAVRYFARGVVPESDILLDEMQVPDSNRYLFPFSDVNHLEFIQPPFNQIIRVFCGARLTWKLPVDPERSSLDYKGSDIMIRGLGKFFRETGLKLDIRLVRKGLHLTDTEKLILDECIADQVTWCDEMSHIEYWDQIAKADIVFDQLGISFIGSPTFDAMAIGRPVIVNARHSLSVFLEPSPICQAETPEEVCAQLVRLCNNNEERMTIGKLGRAYVEKHLNPRPTIQQIENILLEAFENPARQQKFAEASYLYFQGIKHKLDDARLELYDARRELDDARRELDDARRELDDARRELDEAGQELDQTWRKLSDYLSYCLTRKSTGLKKLKLKKPYQNESGFAWSCNLETLRNIADNAEHKQRSTLILFEDNRLLRFSHVIHDDIRNKGKGRYSHWEDTLYFSTSDYSDPNSNGRQYEVMYISHD